MTWSPWDAMRVVRELDAKAPTKAVLFALVLRADATGLAWPGSKRLASDAGLHERTCRQVTKGLAEAGLIRRQARPQQSFQYDLTPLLGAGGGPAPCGMTTRTVRAEDPDRIQDPHGAGARPGGVRAEDPGGAGGGPDDLPKEEAQLKKPKKKPPFAPRRTRRTKSLLPDDFEPRAGTTAWARRHHAVRLDANTVAAELDKFRLNAEQNARLAADWQAAFRTWLMKAREYRPALPEASLFPGERLHRGGAFDWDSAVDHPRPPSRPTQQRLRAVGDDQ